MIERLAKAAEAAAEISGETEFHSEFVTNWPEVVRAVLREMADNPDMDMALKVFGGSWHLYEVAQFQKWIDTILDEKPASEHPLT